LSVYAWATTIAFLLYLEMGIYILYRNRRDKKNLVLGVGCVLFAVISLCQALIYSAPDKDTCFFLYHIYSPLVIMVLCIFLHFTFHLTGNAKYLKGFGLIMIYAPGIILGVHGILGYNMIMDFELRGNTWFEVMARPDVWVLIYIACYYTFFAASTFLIIRWGKKSGLLKEKMQARLIMTGFGLSFLLSALINYILPFLVGKTYIPRMSSVVYLFMLFSIWLSMFRYDFLGAARAAAGRSRLWRKLSTREKMIIPLICKGLTYKETAEKLFISTGTVRKHMENIYRKTGTNNKTRLITEIYGPAVERPD
jgi:DNA-binding CsgD family transcriptional regulator